MLLISLIELVQKLLPFFYIKIKTSLRDPALFKVLN